MGEERSERELRMPERIDMPIVPVGGGFSMEGEQGFGVGEGVGTAA